MAPGPSKFTQLDMHGNPTSTPPLHYRQGHYVHYPNARPAPGPSTAPSPPTEPAVKVEAPEQPLVAPPPAALTQFRDLSTVDRLDLCVSVSVLINEQMDEKINACLEEQDATMDSMHIELDNYLQVRDRLTSRSATA